MGKIPHAPPLVPPKGWVDARWPGGWVNKDRFAIAVERERIPESAYPKWMRNSGPEGTFALDEYEDENPVPEPPLRDCPANMYIASWRRYDDAAGAFAAPVWALVWLMTFGKFGRLPFERVDG